MRTQTYYTWVVCLRVDLGKTTRGKRRELWERRGELERDGVFITCIISQGQACESNCRWFHYKICFHPRGYGNETIYSTVPTFTAVLEAPCHICSPDMYLRVAICRIWLSFLPVENIPMEAPPPLFVLECLWWSLVYKFYQLYLGDSCSLLHAIGFCTYCSYFRIDLPKYHLVCP